MTLFSIGGESDGQVIWRVGDLREANALLATNHYLGPLNAGGARLIVIGESGGEVVAAQVWRSPTSRRLPPDGSWLELSRWCLTESAGLYAGSRQHRAAVRLIRRLLPNATTLVSYSDPSQGHTGALYRSCNWTWAPTWLRLRPPPGGHGAWTAGNPETVKDRWIFALCRDAQRDQHTYIDDPGAIRYWAKNATASEIRWATKHPQLSSVRHESEAAA